MLTLVFYEFIFHVSFRCDLSTPNVRDPLPRIEQHVSADARMTTHMKRVSVFWRLETMSAIQCTVSLFSLTMMELIKSGLDQRLASRILYRGSILRRDMCGRRLGRELSRYEKAHEDPQPRMHLQWTGRR